MLLYWVLGKNKDLEFGISIPVIFLPTLKKCYFAGKKVSFGLNKSEVFYWLKFSAVICSVFASAFSGFRRKLFDLNVDDKYLWAQALTGLQTSINSEIRNLYSTGRFTVLKELEAVNTSVKKLYPMIQDGVDFQRD